VEAVRQRFNRFWAVLSPELVSPREKGTLPTHFGQLSGCCLKCLNTFQLIGC
jgi:hypothetical protein